MEALGKVPTVIYAYVVEDEGEPHQKARYTRGILRQTLQLMGCKPRLAHKASEKVFHVLQQRASLHGRGAGAPPGAAPGAATPAPAQQQQGQPQQGQPQQGQQQWLSSVEQLRPGCACVTLVRSQFRQLVADCLAVEGEVLQRQLMQDFGVACSLQEQRSSVTVLLCGTSGTGKSTLASLLAGRLGITNVVSTDSIRHMMRSFSTEAQDPLLWGSTYQAGEFLTRMAGEAGHFSGGGYGDAKKAAIKGYKAQSEMVVDHLDRLISSCESRRQSLLVEGVHLSLNFVVRLMQRHPTIVPFLVHISNEAKHMERFAVRAKAMTLRAEGNRYVKYLRTIRAIQDYLCKTADKRAIPKVDNTNVDRSVATIHATLLGCLRRRAQGEAMLDGGSLRCKVVLEEYLRCKSATWSSRDMLDLIRRRSQVGRGAENGGGANGYALSSASEGPSTSAASTPKGPLSAVGDAALNDNRSFYGQDSASSEDGSERGGGGDGRERRGGSTESEDGTAGTAGGARPSCVGSVLEIDDGRSDDDGHL